MWKNDSSEEFETTYYGPQKDVKSNLDANKNPKGCGDFFKDLGIHKLGDRAAFIPVLCIAVHALSEWGKSQKWASDGFQRSMDNVADICCKFSCSWAEPEHYFLSIGCQANGSLAFARGEPESDIDYTNFKQAGRNAKSPKEIPLMPPRTKTQRNIPLNVCLKCRPNNNNNNNNNKREMKVSEFLGGAGDVRHGGSLNGSKPKFLVTLNLNLLTPEINFADLRGERAKRASLDEDEHIRDEFREMATDGYIHYSANIIPLNSFGSIVQKRLTASSWPLERCLRSARWRGSWVCEVLRKRRSLHMRRSLHRRRSRRSRHP